MPIGCSSFSLYVPKRVGCLAAAAQLPKAVLIRLDDARQADGDALRCGTCSCNTLLRVTTYSELLRAVKHILL